VVWVNRIGIYPYVTIAPSGGAYYYTLATPIKLVEKPKPLSEILKWFEDRGWKYKGSGWEAPEGCCAESRGVDFSYFDSTRIRYAEQGEVGGCRWHEDWITKEYIDL
jgi:hypothetical protein